MTPVRVIYLCRYVPVWRLPQLRALLRDPKIAFLKIFCVSDGRNHKHSGILNYTEDKLSIEALPCFSATIPSYNRSSTWHFSPTLGPSLIRERPDVILMEGGSNFPNNLIGYAYASATSTPVVWWSLGAIPGRKYGFLGKIFRKIIRYLEGRADSLIGYSSRAIRYYLSNGIDPGRCFKATNVIDVDTIITQHPDIGSYRMNCRQELGLDPESPVLIFVGSLNAAKRSHILPNILKKVRVRYPGATMTIIGSGPELNALRIATRQQDMCSYVRFMGAMTDGVGAHIAAADVMVLPGLGGLVIGESLAYGTPVVCATADGTEEDLIVNGESGFIVGDEPDDMAACENFSAAIFDILSAWPMNASQLRKVRMSVQENNTLANYAENVRRAIFHAIEAP